LNEEINIKEEEKTISKQFDRLNSSHNSTKLIGSLFSIVVVLGVSFQLDLIYTWIPASFLLMFIWSGYSVYSTSKKVLVGDKANKQLKVVKQLRKEFKMYGIVIFLKNLSAMMKAITIVYLFNIIIVLLHLSGKISLPFSGSIELFFVILISIYFTIGVLFLRKFERYVEKKVLPTMQSMKQYTLKHKIFAAIFFIFVIVIPLIVFLLVMSSVKNWWFLFIVLFLQFFIIILLHSFFSLQQLTTELHKTLTQIQRIKDGEISRDSILEVVKFSRYNIDETFKIIQIYMFKPHPIYLEEVRIAKHKRKSRK
jgi:hypothetical protein